MCQSARPYVDSAEQRELLNRANQPIVASGEGLVEPPVYARAW